MAEISETLDRAKVPFDAGRLDRLMEEAGIDVLLATSKHNTRYLMGGYSFLFFSAMDAIGHSRYLPVLIYAKGRPDRAGYVGHRMEAFDHEVRPFWTPAIYTEAASTSDAATLAAAHLAGIGAAGARIGIEPGFLPVDAQAVLAARLDGARFVDATGVLERLRAVKTPAELAKLQEGSELHHRRDAGDDRLGARRDDQGRDHRTAAPRGGRARAAFRLLPADARVEPQPGAVGSGLGGGRGAVDRFRRQSRRLYRRPGADGRARRAGRGARGPAGRGRGGAAGGVRRGAGRGAGARDRRAGARGDGGRGRTAASANSSPTAWG